MTAPTRSDHGSVFVGLEAIGALFERSRHTIGRWIVNEGFPACQLPNNQWVTTQRLIDDWLAARVEIQKGRKVLSQGRSSDAAAA